MFTPETPVTVSKSERQFRYFAFTPASGFHPRSDAEQFQRSIFSDFRGNTPQQWRYGVVPERYSVYWIAFYNCSA